MFAVIKARWFFPGSTLLLLLLANGAFADGTYQHTKDRKTLVWNSDPQPGDAATWSGKRDENGYATGYGTLTWQTGRQSLLTGSNIPSVKYKDFARYSGNMVRGKLDGAVTALAKGRTSHATFVKGRKTGSWVAGAAPTRTRLATETRTEIPEENAAAEPAPPAAGPSPATNERQSQALEREVAAEAAEPEPPTEGPPPDSQQKAGRHVSGAATRETPKPEMDDSLRSLVGPPALLRKNAAAEASPHASIPAAASSPPQPSVSPEAASSPPPARAQLTASEVIGLADTEASTQGYDLGEYQLPKPRYVTANGTWSVDYEPKDGHGADKHFSVSVEDKTKRTSLGK
jgi:hypothetical protein